MAFHALGTQPADMTTSGRRLKPPSEEELQAAARLKVLLGDARKIAAVTGLDSRDGQTDLPARLAIALALLGPDKVLLVNGDAGNTKLNRHMGVPDSPGLGDLLENQLLREAIHTTAQENLFYMPTGAPAASLRSLMTGPALKSLFEELGRQYRWILINTGVMTASPEGLQLGSVSDGAVLSLAVGVRRQHEVTECVEALEQFGIKLLGAVLLKEA